MDLFLLAAAVLIIVLCITLVFIRRATKTGEAAKPKEKKRKKVKKEKEIDEKLDKITGGGEEVKGEDRETAKGEGEKLDEETLNLGKELVEEGVMDKYMIEGDLEGIDDMYLESGGKEDFDFEGLGDKKSITADWGEEGIMAEGPNDDLFTELKKLSTFERRDEFNIMRAYKKKKFDLANLKNELTGAVDKLERDKRQGKIRVRRKRRRI